jgi:hypothetical protein
VRYKLNTLQVVSSQKKGKTIHSDAREIISCVNHHCKQEEVKKSLILPICHKGERTVNCCGGLVTAMKQIR